MRKLIIILVLTLFFYSGYSQLFENDKGIYEDQNHNPYTGSYTEYYDNGIKKAELILKDGKLNGINYLYFSTGQLNEVRSYLSGIMHGTWETYNITGIKTAEAHYNQGKKDGKWIIWDESGIIRYEMYYNLGEKTGTWLMYDEKGTLLSKKDYTK